MVRRFDAGGEPAGSGFVVADTSVYFDVMSVAPRGDGGFVVVWVDSFWDIRGRIFGSDDLPLAPGFLINTYTTGRQIRSAVSARDDGRFLCNGMAGPTQRKTGPLRRCIHPAGSYILDVEVFRG
jgi:hypothetical protein